MPRPTSKAALLDLSRANLASMLDALDSLPAHTKSDTGFQADIDNQSRSPRDILTHIHAWHRLLLGWYSTGMAGGRPSMPAPGYTWRQTPALNAELWEEFRDTPYETALALIAATHGEVMAIIEAHDDEQLFTKQVYPWTGGTTLGSLCVSTTSSHYEWGRKTARDIVRWIGPGQGR